MPRAPRRPRRRARRHPRREPNRDVVPGGGYRLPRESCPPLFAHRLRPSRGHHADLRLRRPDGRARPAGDLRRAARLRPVRRAQRAALGAARLGGAAPGARTRPPRAPPSDDLLALADAVREAARPAPAAAARARRGDRPRDRPPRPPARCSDHRLTGRGRAARPLGSAPWPTPSTPRTSTPSSRRTTSAAPSPTRSTRSWPAPPGARSCEVIGADDRRRRPRHAAELARHGRRLRRRRDRGRRRRRADRAGLHRPALLRLRAPRPPRRDVHREPQPGAVQRHQDVPRRRAADRHGDRARRDPRRGGRRRGRRPAAAPGHDHRARRARGVRRPPAHASPRSPAAGSRSSSTPATGWPATPRPRSSAASASSRSSWCRCTSSSTAPSRTTRPTRSSRTTSSTSRRRVLAEGADIGLAFDGDADRCFLVDERGRGRLAVDADRADRRPRAGQGARARR